MKPLGTAGMQAVINVAGSCKYSTRISIVSQHFSMDASAAQDLQFCSCESSGPITRNGEREQCT